VKHPTIDPSSLFWSISPGTPFPPRRNFRAFPLSSFPLPPPTVELDQVLDERLPLALLPSPPSSTLFPRCRSLLVFSASLSHPLLPGLYLPFLSLFFRYRALASSHACIAGSTQLASLPLYLSQTSRGSPFLSRIVSTCWALGTRHTPHFCHNKRNQSYSQRSRFVFRQFFLFPWFTETISPLFFSAPKASLLLFYTSP